MTHSTMMSREPNSKGANQSVVDNSVRYAHYMPHLIVGKMKKLILLIQLLVLNPGFSLPNGVTIIDGVARIPGERLFGPGEFREMQFEAKRYPNREILYETPRGKVLISGNFVELVPDGAQSHAELLDEFAFATARGLYWEELEMRDLPPSPFRDKIRVYLAEIYDHGFDDRVFAVGLQDREGKEVLNTDPFASPGPSTVRVAQPINDLWQAVSFPRKTRFIEHIWLGPAGHGSLVISPVKGLCMAHEVFSVRFLDSEGRIVQHFPELLNGDVAIQIVGDPREDVTEIFLHSNDHGTVTVYSILLKYQPDASGQRR